jgi:pSer/pThr/pTyr-binding forkhead associated (FHA) protein
MTLGFTFGRSRAAQVVIADQSVSKVHFSLRAVESGVELEDMSSKNGTWFGRRRVRRMALLFGFGPRISSSGTRACGDRRWVEIHARPAPRVLGLRGEAESIVPPLSARGLCSAS